MAVGPAGAVVTGQEGACCMNELDTRLAKAGRTL